MSSRNLMAGEKSLYSVTIARDAIAVIAPPKNSVQGLPLTKVRDVFSGKIRNWRELGGHDHPIILVTREEGSGTGEAFQKLVMGKEEINLVALVQNSNGPICHAFSYIPNPEG